MLCDNCGKKEANVHYLRNINGIKKEMNLCEECSKKLGINNIGFNMPIDFSSFFGEFLEDFANSDFMPLIEENKELKCPGCNSTFDEIARKGKFQCPKCYETFENQIDEIIKKIQGSNTHVGRLGMSKPLEVTKQVKHNNKINNKFEELKLQLKQAIKEERYEDAATLRDEIKKMETSKKDK